MTQNRHEVSGEDAQRLERLSDEVGSRLAEITQIISRITGSEHGEGSVQSFVPRGAVKAEAAAAFDWIEIVEIVPGFNCCYGSIGGQTILECPCGAG
jgi:hypothetical protein